jgi:hypothetical protein
MEIQKTTFQEEAICGLLLLIFNGEIVWELMISD